MAFHWSAAARRAHRRTLALASTEPALRQLGAMAAADAAMLPGNAARAESGAI
jgi:hypothetical protein